MTSSSLWSSCVLLGLAACEGTAADSEIVTGAAVGDVVTLHQASIGQDEQFTLEYSKNFATCLHIREEGVTLRYAHRQNFFCQQGSNVRVTVPLEKLSFIANRIKVCHGNDGRVCSATLPISAPPHPLIFKLRCNLAGHLAEEMGEGASFDCAAPSATLRAELRRRLSQYVDDLNRILGKQTVRRFAWDPATGIVLTPVKPQSDSLGHVPLNFGRIYWVDAQLTDQPRQGTYGGYGSSDISGAGVLAGLRWDRIHDPAQVPDDSETMRQYWRQLDHMIHEAEHVMGAGLGEYYSLGWVPDPTADIDPIANIEIFTPDNPFWAKRREYFGDPLLLDIYDRPEAGRPRTRQALFDKVKLAPVTAAVLNNRWDRNPLEELPETVPDMSAMVVRVVDATTGRAIPGAHVRGWTVWRHDPPATPLFDGHTDADGRVTVDWRCVFSCFGNNAHLKLFKVAAPGYLPAAEHQTVYDAQTIRMVGLERSSTLTIRMTPASS